jgi:hypothetical protein
MARRTIVGVDLLAGFDRGLVLGVRGRANAKQRANGDTGNLHHRNLPSTSPHHYSLPLLRRRRAGTGICGRTARGQLVSAMRL